MSCRLSDLIVSAQERARRARSIADQFRDNDRLHRLAIETALVLDEAIVTLKSMPHRGAQHLPPDMW